MKLRTFVHVIVVALLTASLSGCGYSLAGRGSFLPAYIKTIGLPLFVNNTPIFDVERRITDKVRTELIGRGRYTVKSETTGVDAVLTGEIMSISLAPTAFNQQQQATRYALTLVAKIEFKDLKTNKVLWSNPGMAYSEQFDVTSFVGGTANPDAGTFLGQNVNALERLASEFARAVVSAILESF
jgi:outer membrane lipopolysaccharide assembly protein LptE/RlpB